MYRCTLAQNYDGRSIFAFGLYFRTIFFLTVFGFFGELGFALFLAITSPFRI